MTGIGRFLRLSKLHPEVQDWVEWGAGRDFVGFSCAAELARLEDGDDQRIVGKAVLSRRLSSKEVRQISQLRQRSDRPIQDCVEEIVGMRPVVERRHVFMGAVTDPALATALGKLGQMKRDELLAAGVHQMGLEGAAGRLGDRIFTLVGDEAFGRRMERVGKGNIERLVREHLRENIDRVTAGG